MKLVDKTVTGFVTEVASNSPAPGGGSVSALASSLGVALTRMVGALSVNKKKFKELDESTKQSFLDVINRFESLEQELVQLIDKDTEAFNVIMKAFQMPKDTPEQKELRSKQILAGTLIAIDVPMEVASISSKALKQLEIILTYGNKNTLSDLGVSTLMLYAGLEGALLNVKINLPGIDDEELKNNYEHTVHHLLSEASNIRDAILLQIHQKL